ncbi:MAG: hypothetical protein DRG76_06080 [Deltaproteobacteria bacterium]|nr:MAG: hypothetical protein DRG76_06080 [Deltaproteobacteria bacterium]
MQFKAFCNPIALVYFIIIIPFGYGWIPVVEASNASSNSSRDPKLLQDGASLFNTHLGGRFKLTGSVSRQGNDTIFKSVGAGTYYETGGELRLINETFVSENMNFEVHYQAIYSRGETFEKTKKIKELFAGVLPESILSTYPDDDRRLWDLTHVIRDSRRSVLYHRLDRLNVAFTPSWGSIRIGRQSVTWGNGLIFNPMDMFNPFPPTAVDRTYKTGDDTVNAQVGIGNLGDLQILYVARRNPESHAIAFNQSSAAAKLHMATGTTEFDIMGAHHYKDAIVGVGSRGYLGGAAWRLDIIWTFLEEGKNYLSLVANMDYSWTWLGRNVYGLVEFFHNGIGKNNYSHALVDPEIAKRLSRGELFVLGRDYFASEIQVELHPLVHVFLTVIGNLHDPSGIIQSRAIWDATQNLQLILGTTIEVGEKGTEFGGFPLSGTGLCTPSQDRIFLWTMYYF